MNFTIGQKLKKIILTYLTKKYMNIVLEYTTICGIVTFGGGVSFLKGGNFRFLDVISKI